MSRREISVDPAFSERLRKLRTARGMSYRDFGTISRSYVHELENGRKRPTPEIAAALDKALGAHGQLAALVTVAEPAQPDKVAGEDEIEALELVRRRRASHQPAANSAPAQQAANSAAAQLGPYATPWLTRPPRRPSSPGNRPLSRTPVPVSSPAHVSP